MTGKLVRLHLTTETVQAERTVALPDGEFDIRFRPVAPAEHRRHMQEMASAGADAAKRAAIEAGLLGEHVTDWNVAGPDGAKLPCTAASFAALPQAAFNALYAEVMTYTGATLLGNSAAS